MNEQYDPNEQNMNEQNTNNAERNEPPIYYESVSPAQNASHGFAIASLVLGIISVVCCCFYPLGLTLGALAIIFAIIDRRQHGVFNGLATAGLVLGIIGAAIGVFSVIDAIVNPFDYEAFWQEYENMMNGGGIPTAFRALFHR